jgi:hypothetical protein
MLVKRAVRVLLIVLTVPILFCVWFNIAADYDPPRLAGTYTFHNANISTVLILKADETFTQTLTADGQTKYAKGTWHREGEGGVTFSGDFLRLPGQKSYADTPGSDEASWRYPEFYGHFEKIWTIYPKLSLDGGDKEIVLHRRLFPGT